MYRKNAEFKKSGSENGQTLAHNFGQGLFFANFQRFASVRYGTASVRFNSLRVSAVLSFLAS